MNHIVLFLYRIGILAFLGGGFFLVLTTKGRKTGKKRETPLEYRIKDGVIHVFAARGKKADWYRNMKANPQDSRVQVRFQKFQPELRFIDDLPEKEEVLRWYISEYPNAARFLFGWNKKTDDPETADLSSLLKMLEIVQIREKEIN